MNDLIVSLITSFGSYANEMDDRSSDRRLIIVAVFITGLFLVAFA